MGVHEVGSAGSIGNTRIPLPEIRRVALRELSDNKISLTAFKDGNRFLPDQLGNKRLRLNDKPRWLMEVKMTKLGITLLVGDQHS